LFERPKIGEKATLVHSSKIDHSQSLEFTELARSAGGIIAGSIFASGKRPNARYYLGKGKLDELRLCIEKNNSELVIIDAALSPSQEKNIEQYLKCRVLDRSGLILDIFAQRARSFEGKLQVELAQLRHISTRLIRGWTHLERQKGGIGLRGPGETQLETDRRLIDKRIRQLMLRLKQVDKRRSMSRQNRLKSEIPTVAIVGYTNAGKSTLFKQLTGADVLVKDQLFATLDPTMRRLDLPEGAPIILVDTVGFIKELPHELVAAFRATLQEAKEADLILHIIDGSDPNRWQRIKQVNNVLKQLEADKVPQLRVYNKIDKLNYKPKLTKRINGSGRAAWVSALKGEGLNLLMTGISSFFARNLLIGSIKLNNSQGKQRAKLFQMGAVKEEKILDDGSFRLALEITKQDIYRFLKKEGMSTNAFVKM
jgi:GTP-binding protein HflX|tara:strand:- start:10033 stop:11307 length:1275 start_codon:yes stop_codon:yes gene_type:complete